MNEYAIKYLLYEGTSAETKCEVINAESGQVAISYLREQNQDANLVIQDIHKL